NEDQPACEYCERPAPVVREPAVRQAEGGARDGAGQDAYGGRSGEGEAVIQRKEEDDRGGGEWQAGEPAADRRSPAPASEADCADEGRRQHELESECVHLLFKTFSVPGSPRLARRIRPRKEAKPMPTTLPRGSEVPSEQPWDLASIFPSDAAWDEAARAAEAAIPDLDRFRGRLAEAATPLFEALQMRDRLRAD